MAIVYIDPTVSGTGSGTFSDPYKSWSSVTWTASNTYLQKGGTTFTGTITYAAGGVAGAPLVIGSYDPATGAQLYGGNNRARVDANQGQYGIVNSGVRNYVSVIGMEVFNCLHTSSATGIYMSTSAGTNFTVTDCLVHDVYNTGTTVGSTGIKWFSDNAQILRNIVYTMGDDAMYGEGDNVEVAYNYVYNVSVLTTGGDCCQMADTTISSSNPWIHNNYFIHREKDCKQCYIITSGAAGGPSSGGVVEDNTFLGFQGGTLHKPIYAGNSGMVIRRNYIEGGIRAIDCDANSAGTAVYSNVIVSSSTTVNCQGVTIGAASTSVYNNTLVQLGGTSITQYGIQQAANVASCSSQNNIVVGWTYGIRKNSTTPMTEDHNNLYRCGTPVVNDSLASQSLGTGSITTDPKLSSAYIPTTATGVFTVGTGLGLIRDKGKKLCKNFMGAYGYARIRIPPT